MKQNYVKKSHLPINNASVVLMAKGYDYLNNEIKRLGVSEIILVTPCKELYPAEQCHADMQFLHLGENKILAAENSCQEAIKRLISLGFEIDYTDNKLQTKYPENISLNVLAINNSLIGKLDSIDKKIPLIYENYRKSEVKQGYTKCSTAIVSDNAIITADKGIYLAALHNDIDALLINSGGIELPGMSCGFIGECSFKLSQNILAFTGNIKLHPDYQNIKAFAQNHGVNLISLSEKPPIDIGGVLPIMEWGD